MVIQSFESMFQERARWKSVSLCLILKIHVASLMLLLFKRITKVSVYPRGEDLDFAS